MLRQIVLALEVLQTKLYTQITTIEKKRIEKWFYIRLFNNPNRILCMNLHYFESVVYYMVGVLFYC